MTLSVGGIQEILHAIRQVVQPAVETLTQQARRSRVRSRILYDDETGWHENGQDGFIWSASAPSDNAGRSYEDDHPVPKRS